MNVKLKLVVFFAALVVCLDSAMAKSELREESYQPGVITREGLALARIITSPMTIFTLPASMWRDHKNAHDGKVNPLMAFFIPVFGVCGGAVGTGLEIGVGTCEMLTFSQMKSQAYGWEMTEPREKEEYLADEKKNRRKGAKIVEDAINQAKQEAVNAIDAKIDTEIRRAVGGGDYSAEYDSSSDGTSTDEQSIASGYATIKGPNSLREGQFGTYKLYVGGQLIRSGISWRTDGTSITLNDFGDHARVMAGNPPIKSGSYKTGIAAIYGGKSFTKSIRIIKTGKSATVNKYKR